MKILIYLFLSSISSAAEPPPNIALSLSDLVPAGQSLYHTANPNTLRFYLRFKNSLGSHFFVYEEDSTQPVSREVHALLRVTENSDSTCLVNLECTTKPFCTGDCQNMYYQLSNIAPNSTNGEGSKCQIVSYTCNKRTDALNAPSAAPVPLKPAPLGQPSGT